MNTLRKYALLTLLIAAPAFAQTAATSFVITASAAPVTDPACLSYTVVN